MPTVLISTASGDDDQYVEELFRDLRRHVSMLTGKPERDAAVLSTAVNGSRVWSAETAEALARAHVFLALYSPRYHVNEVCGRQLWIFNDRLRRYEQQHGVRPPALISVAWTLTDPPPAVKPSIVVPRHAGERCGLRQLARLRDLRQEYEAFVADLAEKIVSVARAHPLPGDATVPELVDTPNAFAATGDDQRGAVVGAPLIHFVVVAGSRQEMAPIRENLVFYGADSADWAPYRPALSQSLADHARSLAANQLFESEVGSVQDVVERIERARDGNEIVVVLVDWWTTQLETYQRILSEIDRRGLGATAVLVPANGADPETAENREELRFGLRRTFRNATSQPDALFRAEIESPDRFDTDLAGVIEEARNRIYRDGRVHHLPPGEPRSRRPILSGP